MLSSTPAGVETGHTPIVFVPAPGDVVLRGSMDGRFTVLDAIRLTRMAGPFSLVDALAFARQRGARHIYQQPVDERGRSLADPAPFAVEEHRASAD